MLEKFPSHSASPRGLESFLAFMTWWVKSYVVISSSQDWYIVHMYIIRTMYSLGQSPKLHWRVSDPLHCRPPFLAGVWIVRVFCPSPQALLQELQSDHLRFTFLLFTCPLLRLFLLRLHFLWSLQPSSGSPLQNGLTHRSLCLIPTFFRMHLHRSSLPGSISMSVNVP